MEKFDFSGWATRNDLLCSDGRVIMKDAFKDCDGMTVPLVWNHDHKEAESVLGHALLENRDEGVYTYGYFNDTKLGQHAKLLVDHGDITALSIYANKLKHSGPNVVHGAIREVSLVLAGANPGAFIDNVTLEHGEDGDSEAVIYTDEYIELYHAEEKEEKKGEENMPEENKKAPENGGEKTVQEVFDTLTEEQKTVVYALVGQALEDAKGGSDDDEGEDEEMKHNIFENDYENQGEVLTHSEIAEIFSDAKRLGSLREAVLEHGITNIEYLFPEAQLVGDTPEWIKREDSWVSDVMDAVHKTPFAKVKSMAANITEDEARAKGYIKGNLKKEEVFSLLKRQTGPTTIYKKQKLDRDDMIDMANGASFNFVAWLKAEMKMMIREETARAILVGDGRLASSDDKINEQCIRPIYSDAALYTVKKTVTYGANDTDDAKAKKFIRAAVKARKDYKGSGNPVLFTTEDLLTDMLLIEDVNGRVIYETEDKLRSALRVSKIVTVPVMEGLTRTGDDSETLKLEGIIVNLKDYNVGADKGGELTMFDDFDIDYNQQKYLMETRCSGALIKPFSAIVIESTVAAG